MDDDEIDIEREQYLERMQSPTPYGQMTVDGKTLYIYRVVYPVSAKNPSGGVSYEGFGVPPGKTQAVSRGATFPRAVLEWFQETGYTSVPMTAKGMQNRLNDGATVVLLHSLSEVPSEEIPYKPPPVVPPPASAFFSCPVCGKMFASQAQLATHMTEHPQKAKATCPVAMILVPVIGAATVLTAFILFLL
jgi:hypothetical protein